MTYTLSIAPERQKLRMRPLKAWQHMKNLLADNEATDQVFHIMEALNGGALERDLRRFAKTEKGQQRLRDRRFLPDVLDNHTALLKLPQDSLGRAYVTFMQREGLTAAGLVAEHNKWGQDHKTFDDDLEFYANRLRDTHDMLHVLTGYGRDKLGEISVLAFSHSQNRGLGTLFISVVGGLDLRKDAPKSAKILNVIREAKRHGKQAQKISEQDIVELLPLPISEVREKLGIAKPALYMRALSILHEQGYEGQASVAYA